MVRDEGSRNHFGAVPFETKKDGKVKRFPCL